MEMSGPQIGRALVVIVDDRVSAGERSDGTGPLVTELLGESGFLVDGVVGFEFESSSNVNYRLECSTDTSNWVPLNIIIEGLGQTETTFDPGGFDPSSSSGYGHWIPPRSSSSR